MKIMKLDRVFELESVGHSSLVAGPAAGGQSWPKLLDVLLNLDLNSIAQSGSC